MCISDSMQHSPASWGDLVLGIVLQPFAQHRDSTNLFGIKDHVKAIIKADAAKGDDGGAKAGSHAYKLRLLGPEQLVLLPSHLVCLHCQLGGE